MTKQVKVEIILNVEADTNVEELVVVNDDVVDAVLVYRDQHDTTSRFKINGVEDVEIKEIKPSTIGSEFVFYHYSGFAEPEHIVDGLDNFIANVNITGNYMGDVTVNVIEDINELVDSCINEENFEEDLKGLLFEYNIFVNPTYEELKEFNISRRLDEDEYISSFKDLQLV